MKYFGNLKTTTYVSILESLLSLSKHFVKLKIEIEEPVTWRLLLLRSFLFNKTFPILFP